jgi:KUP system potassium uptake protein
MLIFLQLLAQIMKLSYFPQVKVVHTSKVFHGQLYVPLVNWLLMIGTVLVAAIYKNTTSLGNAYGVCVMFVTFFDTCMVSLAAMFVWRISPYWVFLPWLTISLLDSVYLSSALTKVPNGAWFTLTLSSILTALFILWRFGKEQQWAAESADRFPTTHFVKKQGDRTVLTPKYGGGTVSTMKGFGIFFDKDGATIPPVFSQFLIKLVAAPQVMVLFHLRPLETPSVPAEDRYNVSRLALPNCYRLVVRHGYSDIVINPDLASLIYEQIKDFIIRESVSRPTMNGITGHKQTEYEKENEETDPATATATTSATDIDKHTPSTPSPSSDIADSHPITHRPPLSTNPQTPLPQNQAHSTSPSPSPSKTALALTHLNAAYTHQTLYIIGKSQLKILPTGSNIFRRTLLHVFLWIRENTRSKIAQLKVPTDRVFEVGFVKDI